MSAAVCLRGVSVAREGRAVLSEVSVRIRRGEFTAVIGPNGGGKSTLLKLLLGLVRPSAGGVRVLGLPPERARARVGYVPQHIPQQPGFPLSAAEVVAMGLPPAALRGLGAQRRQRERIAAALAQVGVEALLERPFAALSGGQRQRVFIARALIGEPDLLLFDEPTANVDPDGSYCFHALLQRLRGQLSILLVSHDFSVTAPMVDSVACVNHRLIYNPEPALSAQMLALIYGMHTDACPMGCYLSDLSKLVLEHQRHVLA